jgi:hypothetical protein
MNLKFIEINTQLLTETKETYAKVMNGLGVGDDA